MKKLISRWACVALLGWLWAVLPAQAEEPIIKLEAGFTTPAADGSAQLVITAKIEHGWHIYSLTQGTGGPVTSRIQVDKTEGLQVQDAFQPTVAPEVKNDAAFPGLPIETHEGKVTWFAPIKIVGSNPQSMKIVGRVRAQACNDSNCMPPQDFEFSAEWSKDLALQKAGATNSPPAPQPASPPPAPPPTALPPPANQSTNAKGDDATPDVGLPAFGLNDPLNPLAFAGNGDATVQIDSAFTKPAADGSAQLIVTAKIQHGWHIYSLTQPAGGPIATEIKVDNSADYQVTGPFLPETLPARKAIKNVGIEETYQGHATWMAPLKIVAKDLKSVKVTGKVNVEACTGNNCTPPRDIAFTAELSSDLVPLKPAAGAAAAVAKFEPPKPDPAATNAPAVAPAKQDQLQWQPFTTIAALNLMLGHEINLASVQDFVSAQARTSLTGLKAILFGFLGGLILNIMPCVLPVVGLKIMSFIEQSGHNRRKAFMLNAWYSLGLLSVFFLLALLAVFANMGWGQLFAQQWFIIALSCLVFAMGLSFLGVWEIPIPGFAGRGAESKLANKEGATGAFVKGALTTVLATPCTAPYLAPALVWAAAQPAWLTYAVFLSAGLGMSFPYLLIGAFPALMSFLPKPGMWMETFKHIMGFVLMGTVVFFLSSLDPAFVVPTVGMLFALWAACWWIGRVSPLASRSQKSIAWAWATAFAVIAGVLMFPAFDDIVRPRVGFASVTDIMRQRLGYVNGVAKSQPSALQSGAGPMMVAMRPRAVMIDFTANWCLNCKAFERAVLDQQPVIDAIGRHNVLPLKADWTTEDPEVTKMLVVLNAGRPQIPVLAIFNPQKPNEPIVFPGPCSQSELLEAIEKIAPLEKADAARVTIR